MKQENQNKVQDLQNGNTESGKQKPFRRTAKRQAGAATTSAAKNTTESGTAQKRTARSGVRTAKKAGGDGTSMNASYLPVYDNAKRAPKTLKNAPKAEAIGVESGAAKTGK